MRKTIFSILPILLIIVMIPALLFACKTKTVGTFDLRIAGADLSWDPVEGAEYYMIICTTPNGSGYTIPVNGTTFSASQTAAGDYTYSAIACNAKGQTIASSEPVLYHLGVGGHKDPILISSVEELQAIKGGSVSVTFGKKTLNAPLYYTLMSDLDLTGKTITPIGTSSEPFRGYFDGNGHTISNLSFTKTGADGRAGLFGTMTAAYIKDLTLTNASIVMDRNSGVSGSGLEYGLLAAYAKDTVFDNCHVTGNIEFMTDVDTSGTSTADLGGIIGYIVGGKVFSCSFKGTVNARYSQVFAGGIVGYASSGTQSLVMANCLSDSTIHSYGTGYDYNNKESKAKSRAGILIGSISGADKLAMCVALGTATAEAITGTSVSDVAGGVFGNTAGSSNTNTVPMIDIFYNSDTIKTVSGTRTTLGTGNTAFGLTAEELKDVSKYVVGDTSALDFDNVWAMGDSHPVLRGNGLTFTHEDVTLIIKSEVDNVTYTFSLKDTFLPNYYSLTANGETRHYTGFQLNNLLTDDLALTFSGAKAVVISAEGREDIRLDVNKSTATFPSTYLLYGTYNTTYSRLPEAYTGVRIIDATKPATPYDITGDTITITIVKADETPAE